MAEPCTSKMLVDNNLDNKQEINHNSVLPSLPIVKPRHKPLTSPIVTSSDIAKELLERAEKRHKSYPDGVDVLLAMKQPTSPLKNQRKEESKLDANELLSILQDGAELHYVEKPKPKVPRLSRGPYKDLKIDPELEKRLALQQLMEFSRKKGRPKKSDSENNNNNNNNNNNRESSKKSEVKQAKQNSNTRETKKTPNRELRKLLQDEGAINMLYSIEKGENENKEKLLPSKRRMKRALIKKAQEVTEALLGGSTSSGVSLRHRSVAEKRKPSTDSIDSEHSDFQFTPPTDSKIIRRHSSSSSYSSRASSPRLASPPPARPDEGVRISEKAEQLIEAKCKELNLQPQHSQLIKKLIHDKQNGFKERLQSEFANKLRAAISRGEAQINSCPDTTNEQKSAIWKMVEEDWGSGSDTDADRVNQNGTEEHKPQLPASSTTPVNTASVTSSVIVLATTSSSSHTLTPTPSCSVTSPTTTTATVSPTKTAAVIPSMKPNIASISPVSSEILKEEKKIPREVSSYREITLSMDDGLASLSLATNSTILPNALSTKVLRELSLALEYVSQSPDVKCIALTSEGPDFCLGFDLPGLLSSDPSERRALAAQAALAIKEFACKVCMLGKPLVAGVTGRAVGLGTVLLAYCDIVLAEPGSSFMTPYPKLGCFPEAAATTLLPHVLGLAQAKKLLLGCAKMSCTEAEACGLASRLVPEGELRREVHAVGKEILSHSHQVMASTKAVVMHGLRTKLPSVLETEVKLLQQHWTSEDCQRRISSLRDNPFF